MATTQSKVSKKNQQKLELETSTKNKWITRLQWILFALAFIIYSNSLSNGYNMDDYLVTKNHRYTSQGLNSETVKNIFTSPYYSDDSGYSYGYRPIVHLSFALEHEIFGESPQAGHFINMLLFAFSVFFLFKFLNLLFGEKNYLYTFLACALFAIHPIHTEVVNSLKNRDEILSFFFTILAGIQVIRHTEKKKISQFILAVLFFFLAILSKKSVYPMVVIIPAAIYLIKEVSFIRLLILTAIMSIPAAVFGSEMQIGRMILMGVFPIMSLLTIHLTVYLLKNWKEYYEKYHLKEVLLLGLPTLLIILLIRYSAQNWNLYFLLLIIPPAFFLLRTNIKVAIWIITLCTLYIAVRFDLKELYTIHLALITSLTLHSYFIQKEKNIPIIILTFVCIIISFIYDGIFPSSYLILNLIGFFWLLSKKNKIPALIYSILTILALLIIPLIRKNDDAFMNSGAIYAYILLTFLLLFFVFKKLSEQKMIQWGFISILFIGFSILSLNSYIENLKNRNNKW